MTELSSRQPLARVTPNLRHAFGGIWRLTFRRFIGPGQCLAFAAMLLLLGLMEFAIVSDGGARAFSDGSVRLYMSFLLPVVSFLSGAGAMRDEMKSGSVDYIHTRPVQRPAFVLFKFLSHLACVQAAAVAAFAVLLLVANLRHIAGLADVVPGLLLAQGLTVTAFVAFGFFCGVLTSRYLVLGLAYGAVVEVGLGRIPTQLGRLSITRQVAAYLQPIMPAAAPASAPEQSAWALAGTLLIVSFVLIALVALIFRLRELVGEHTREN